MKKINLMLIAMAIVATSAFSLKIKEANKNISFDVNVEEGTYKVDTKSSTVGWVGKKIAYGHNGTVDLAGGQLVFEANGLTGGSFKFDMTTIKNIDLEDPKKNAKLVGHLKSDDFFSVKQHPTVSFTITSVEKAQDGDNNYKITGDLAIKGITHPLSFGAKVTENGGNISASAKLTFDRSKYNVKFQSGSFFENLGDKAIYDDIEMNVSLVAKK